MYITHTRHVNFVKCFFFTFQKLYIVQRLHHNSNIIKQLPLRKISPSLFNSPPHRTCLVCSLIVISEPLPSLIWNKRLHKALVNLCRPHHYSGLLIGLSLVNISQYLLVNGESCNGGVF